MKRVLKFICNEFVFGGHITALAALCLVLTASMVLRVELDWSFPVIVYLGVYLAYFFNRYKEHKQDSFSNIKRFEHFKGYFFIMPAWFVFVFFLFIFFVLFYAPPPEAVIILTLFFLGILYSLFLKKLTRKILSFKSFFVSLMWSSVVIFLVFYHSLSLDASAWLFFSFVLLRMFVHSSFFDVKDLESDERENMLTLPIKLSKKNFFYLLNIISFISLTPIISGVYLGLLPGFSLFLVITFFISIYYLYSYDKHREDLGLFSQIAISGEKIVWPLLVLMGKLVF